MAEKRRIGILTGGGDVPGLNVAIKAVVSQAESHNIQVLGIRRGWLGLLCVDPDNPETTAKYTMQLSAEKVRTIDRTGGTILHTSRTNPSSVQPDDVPRFIRQEDRVTTDSGKVDCTRHILRVLDALNIEAIIPIGGDDTLSFARRLHHEGFQVVAIPKTMDNDVFGTDFCIGFSTAVTRSVDAINALRTTAGSHERIGVVELFGRNSGETSLFAAYLADVDRAVISEVPFDIDRLSRFLAEDRAHNPSLYAIMTISEGAYFKGGTILESGEADAYGHKKLGGIGSVVADEIKKRTGINMIYQQLAYIMRSGAPDSLDRMVAVSYGNLALSQIALGHTGRMVALQQGIYTTVPIELVTAAKKHVDVTALYDPENYRPKVRNMLGKPMFLY
ncbi:MAG: Pyrophosphate--fructose 6-phosphate 1-phosphotransferase [Syntrophorhabdaceae bacterium PtaU1.Bin034]|nr:MAG: Pyrophosphate--fructose 6-phosphate 1-phosphotransferase [Syntrophorhabdaceae bacterium PtaU1.Bin034]